MEGILEGLSEKGFSQKNLHKGEKHLPWKGHNSGKPLLITRLDATPSKLVAKISFRFFGLVDLFQKSQSQIGNHNSSRCPFTL